MYDGGSITIDGVRVSEHAIARYMERVAGRADICPAGCAAVMAACVLEGVVVASDGDAVVVRGEAIPEAAVVVGSDGMRATVVTVIEGRDWWVDALGPLMRAIGRALCR